MKEKNVIGVVGENGAGKGTFVKLFQELVPDQDVEAFKSGAILFQTIQRLSQAFQIEIPCTRTNLQNLALILKDIYGDDILSQAVYQRMVKSPAEIVIFDGVRMASDLRALGQFTPHYLVYITADPQTRYQRLTQRSEKAGEKGMSYEQFLQEEQAGTELEIKKIGAAADFTITNNSSLNEFRFNIEDLISKICVLRSLL